MKNNIKSGVMNFKVISTVIILLGPGLFGFVSLSFAQGGSWTTKTGMPTTRYWFSCSVVEDKIYVIGGVAGEGSGLTTVEVYDPATDSWDTTKTNKPTPSINPATAVVGGKIYVMGGDSIFKIQELHATKVVEVYDPITDSWDTTKNEMPIARIAASACVVNDTIYVIGGGDTTGPLNTVEAYDPHTDTWDTTKIDMPTARYALSTCVVNGKIYAIGGFKPQNLLTVEEYDLKSDIWTKKSDMPIKNGYFGACVVEGMIYTVGGTAAGLGDYNKVFLYNPATNTWDTTKPDMPTVRFGLCACAVNGKIYAIGGGVDWPPIALSTVEEYDPVPITKLQELYAEQIPTEFLLFHNYPNPFNPTTTIEFTLPHSALVTLKIYNILGKEITTLVSEELTAGKYEYKWDAADMVSDVYLYKITVGNFQQTKKLILLK